jgi:acetyl esterase/lipase
MVGDSAGGGLVVSTLVALRDAGEPLPAGAVLVSPWVDLSNSASTWDSNWSTDYLPPMGGRPAVEYLGETNPKDPLASPLFADLSGLPPLLIMAGGLEMILEDSTRLADRAEAAGVDVTLVVEPEMFHVWPVIVPRHPASVRAFNTAAHWIQQMVPAD